MSSFYEASTSGMNWDRFTADVNDSLLNESTTLKVKQAYWSAKQLIREKLGRREDEHVVAADAELDMHLQQFRQIRDSTQTLLTLMETNQRELNDLAQLELDIAELLTDAQKDEKAHLRNVLQVTANAQENSSKQRQILLGHVIRFGNVLYDFIERAVTDCEQTVEARSRLDYRGSLLWLKKSSETLDPADFSHMEDFRTVQQVVKGQKHRMDLLKEDVTLKVNVLHKARNRILADHLEEYKTALVSFHSDIAAEFCASSEQFDGLESYEIDVLKILRDPIGLAMEEQHNSEMDTTSSPKRFKSPRPSSSRNRLHSESDTNDLVELEEVELGVEACDPAMERVRELLCFEDNSEDQAERGHVPVENDLLGLAQSDVQWKSPPTAAGIGLNLLKHSSSSTTELLNELQQEWGSLAGCSSSNGKQAVNTAIDEQTLTSAKPGTGRGALLEEIEVNVLHKARNRILADHLEEYKTALVSFHSDIAAEFCASSEQFDGLESYEIDVLKILRDPIGLAMEEQHNSEMDTTNRLHSESDTNDLVELEEVELGVEACDPAMERVRELLCFEDNSEDQAERGHVPVENDLLGLAQSDVQWKSPPTAAGIGLNLLKHSSSSTTELLNELQQEWGSLAGCSSSNGKQAVNTAIDEQTLTSAKPGTGRGALLEEIEDLLFESCSSSPKNNNSNLESNLRSGDLDNTLAFFESRTVTVGNNFELQPNCNDQKCAKTEKGVGAENVPKLAPPPSHATLCIKKD
uniref:AH domain-containing protein n=1 Tax=Globodera pallida TaxID=36090 RepID=A0A183CJZ7_GLOPA